VADEIPVSLNYRSFYDHVINGDISEFTIYKSYESDIDALAQGNDGKTYIVERPFKYEEDDIFIESLKEKGVSVTILDEVYQGEMPEGIKHRNTMMFAGLLFYFIPLALILALVWMAKTISRQAKVIEALTNKMSNPH
jgi:ATP-dependent Zn protease